MHSKGSLEESEGLHPPIGILRGKESLGGSQRIALGHPEIPKNPRKLVMQQQLTVTVEQIGLKSQSIPKNPEQSQGESQRIALGQPEIPMKHNLTVVDEQITLKIPKCMKESMKIPKNPKESLGETQRIALREPEIPKHPRKTGHETAFNGPGNLKESSKKEWVKNPSKS